MQDKIPHTIIAKYLSGEISSDEMVTLNSWRQLFPENEAVFQEYREIWTIAAASDKSVIPDKEIVWKKLKAKILNTVTVKTYSRSFLIRIAGVAAAVALVIGLSFSYLLPFDINAPTSEIIVKAPGGQKSEITLPDGTSVWLNSGSALTYNTKYGTKNRLVQLDGEAFFDVMKNEKQPFEVIAEDIQIQVHGTSFGIKAYKKDETIDVSLLKGHVTVHSIATNRLLADLLPNQKATIDKNTLTSNIEYCNAEVENIWRFGRLRIQGESIAEVAAMMSRWYGVNITVEGKMKNEHYWFTVKTESLTEMLNLINRITPIQYSINGEEVSIRYK